ncbi:MAG: DNA polymerase III subunit delta' [Thermomicrobiales bacterium]|nr:DNA polymerase III subunit delta' [Thermomicrobiales bacterium]
MISAVGNSQSAGWRIWGHRQALATLSQAAASNRVRHAYLLSGQEGVGKKALATSFARALNCMTPIEPGVPCNDCRSCKKIARGVHPDVQVFGLESQIANAPKSTGKNTTLTVETVRTMTATAVLRPVESAWRVLIVDDAELMQETAQEALLKTLEEPPAFAVILLLANDAELLLPTVRSRCQLVELAPLPRRTIESGLIEMGVAADRAAEIAGAAGGVPGWAIRATAEPKLISERREAIERSLSWLGGTPYERVVVAFRLGDSFSKRRSTIFRELEVTLGLWRDALLLKTSTDSAMTFPAAAGQLDTLIRAWSLESIHAALRSVRQCIADLEANVRPRLAIESMVLQWPTT